ncbi:MAG: triose-phosphate isomerase [Hyphomicrobiaceae bacterium]
MPPAPIRPLVAGNWKMNGLQAALGEALKVRDRLEAGAARRADVLICPPATLIAELAAAAKGSRLQVGGQDCHAAPAGAHTGDISAEMLKDAGAVAAIVGHSERRSAHGERDCDVRIKAEAAHRAGLAAIVCIGETSGEREADLTLRVIERQLAASLPAQIAAATTILAYEPVWAIGTGLTPAPDDVSRVHTFIRNVLKGRFGTEGAHMRILYGGSVKPANAAELLGAAHVDGALIGGASLNAHDFLAIAAACSERSDG